MILISSILSAQSEVTTIEVEITNISNDEGQVLVGLYNSEKQWLKEIFKGAFGKIENGKSTVQFTDVPSGTYAISVFHDEDNDGKLDTLFGIPTEDTGSSNDAPSKFGPPKWSVAQFEVKDENLKQIINL